MPSKKALGLTVNKSGLRAKNITGSQVLARTNFKVDRTLSYLKKKNCKLCFLG
jgi:hypothetical protein